MNLDAIDRILIIKEKAEEVYNECKRGKILCPSSDYSAIDTIKDLIREVKEIGRGMNTRSDTDGDLYKIQRLFEYAESFNDEADKILKIDRDKLNRWCNYWLITRFTDYDRLNNTETLPKLMEIIDPETKARAAEERARVTEERSAARAAEAARIAAERRRFLDEEAAVEAAAEAAATGRPMGYGGKKRYMSQNRFSRKSKSRGKSKSRHRKSKSHHRKNRRRAI